VGKGTDVSMVDPSQDLAGPIRSHVVMFQPTCEGLLGQVFYVVLHRHEGRRSACHHGVKKYFLDISNDE
jgi:hypothetical protein